MNPGTSTNFSVYRFLIPTSTLLSNPITSPYFSNANGRMNIAAVPEARLVNYPCRADKLENFVLIYPAHHQEGEEEDWYSITGGSGTRKDLYRVYPDAHSVLKEIFRLAPEDEIKGWPLLSRAPLKSWHKHRCLLVGDAAHPMLPHQAQGGAMAFEDAEALAVVLARMRNLKLAELERSLELFEKIRVSRASAIQILSSVPAEDLATVADQTRPYIEGKVPRSLGEVRTFAFKYNIVDGSEAVLREYLEGDLVTSLSYADSVSVRRALV